MATPKVLNMHLTKSIGIFVIAIIMHATCREAEESAMHNSPFQG
jgi:hypothetical protein